MRRSRGIFCVLILPGHWNGGMVYYIRPCVLCVVPEPAHTCMPAPYAVCCAQTPSSRVWCVCGGQMETWRRPAGHDLVTASEVAPAAPNCPPPGPLKFPLWAGITCPAGRASAADRWSRRHSPRGFDVTQDAGGYQLLDRSAIEGSTKVFRQAMEPTFHACRARASTGCRTHSGHMGARSRCSILLISGPRVLYIAPICFEWT